MVAARFPRARHVEVPYGVHVQAMGASVPCAADLVRSFLADPEGFVAPEPATCAAPRPALHQTFARSAQGIDEGTAAALTVADVVNRVRALGSDSGRGLRGGRWTAAYRGDAIRIRLAGVRFFEGLPMTGTATWVPATGSVRAEVSGPGGEFSVEWSEEAASPTIARAV